MTSDIPTADHPAADPATRRPWWVIVLAILGVAGLAFAIGRFSMFGSAGPLPPGETSAEVGFSRDMQVHHAQAVEMAMEIYRKTEDPEVRVLSYDIATGQSADTDTVVASARAYINAINRLLVRREKSAPGDDTKTVSYRDAG